MKTKFIFTVICAMIISMAVTTAQSSTRYTGTSLIPSDTRSVLVKTNPTFNHTSLCCETKCYSPKTCLNSKSSCSKNGNCEASQHGSITNSHLKANARKCLMPMGKCLQANEAKSPTCCKS